MQAKVFRTTGTTISVMVLGWLSSTVTGIARITWGSCGDTNTASKAELANVMWLHE
jgi:hypothetical protein